MQDPPKRRRTSRGVCALCDQPAEWLGYDRQGEYREVCPACGGEGVEEQLRPAVNSPAPASADIQDKRG